VEDAPAVAVGVGEAVRIHEAEIFGLVVGRTAGGQGFRDEFVDFFAALAMEGKQGFDGGGGVADRLGGEFAEFRVRREHDGDRVAQDEHRGGVVGELGMEGKSEAGEKGLGSGEIGDGEVEADLFNHGGGGLILGSTNERGDFGPGLS